MKDSDREGHASSHLGGEARVETIEASRDVQSELVDGPPVPTGGMTERRAISMPSRHPAFAIGRSGVSALGLATALAIDLSVPLGPALPAPYVFAVLTALASSWTPLAVWIAAAATVANLVVLALAAPSGALQEHDYAIRGLAILAIWAVAILAHRLATVAADFSRIERRPETKVDPGADATERNMLVRELQSKEQLYRAVFEQSFQFLAVVGPDGSPKQVNETLAQFLGKFPDEVLGRRLWDIPGWSEMAGSAGRLEALFLQAMQGDFARDDIVVRGVDGSTRTVDLSLKPVRNEHGEIYLLIMEGRDVTERREQEAMLAQAQKMEAVGQLTSGVAHDFNNLLMVIVGNLELLAARPDSDARTKTRVEKALEAISRGKALTHQLLAFSRKQELKPGPLDVNETLRGMSEMLKSTSPNVDVILELSDDLPLCRVDANQLETTILNLAVNARDAMGSGGRLTISTGLGAVDRQYRAGFVHLPPGEYVRLEVSDTGHGIAPQHMPHLFEPFFTTKPPDKGTGLGLAMVYGFVKHSGGDIKVHSEVGKGTTFRIYLPKADTPTGSDMSDGESAGALAPLPRQGQHRARVLVVEDEHDVREVAVATLSELGYEVEQAPDGDTAVAYFRMGRSYDLLITDIVMAGEHDGVSVALMARAQYREIGVVFASSFPQRALERADGKVKGARFLTKPFSVDDLTRAARAALGEAPAEAVAS